MLAVLAGIQIGVKPLYSKGLRQNPALLKASAPGPGGGCPLESSVPEVTRRQGDEELGALNLTIREGDTQARSASYRALRGSG